MTTWLQVAGGLIGAAAVIGFTVASFTNSRSRTVIEQLTILKDAFHEQFRREHEQRVAEQSDCASRIARLEGQLDVIRGEFVKSLSTMVANNAAHAASEVWAATMKEILAETAASLRAPRRINDPADIDYR